MKRLIYSLLAVAATSLVISASAQPQRISSSECAKQMTEQMVRELKLDSKQQKKVEKINTTFCEATMANRPQMGNGQRPQGGGPNGGPRGGGMRGGQRPNMQGGERPQMNGQRPNMGRNEISQSERDKAIEKRNKSMKEILNPEQYERWCQMEKVRMNQEFNRMGNKQSERPQRGQGRPMQRQAQ